jgi:hypothetical protein
MIPPARELAAGITAIARRGAADFCNPLDTRVLLHARIHGRSITIAGKKETAPGTAIKRNTPPFIS